MCSRASLIYQLLLLSVVALVQVKAQEKIVGGQTTTISDRPYQMQLYYAGSFTCGGTLIKANLVLTAGHCAKGRTAGLFTVKGGATYLSDAGVKRGVKRIILPSAFNSRTMDFDGALLQLSSPMSGTNIKIINLCSGRIPTSATVIVSGWGTTSETGSVSNQLRKVELLITAKNTCQNIYSGALTSTMICAARANKDSCYGDSGGPLTYRNELCGIVSWGYGCAQAGVPGVYTDVNAIKTFINNAIAKFP